MKAMVLAAGFGKRLRPLTEYLPKVLIPILGVPAIDHVLGRLRRYHVGRIGLNVHYLAEQILTYLTTNRPKDLDILMIKEEQILGTGGAIYNFRDFLKGEEPFWIYNGDIICDLDLSSVLKIHRQKKALATLILWDYPPINSVLVDQENNIIDFFSKSKAQIKSNDDGDKRYNQCQSGEGRFLTFTGISIVEPGILDHMPSGCSEMPEIYQNIIKTYGLGKICGVKGRGRYWADFGTISRYLDVHRHIILTHQLITQKEGITAQKGEADSVAYIHRSGEDISIAETADLKGFISIGERCFIEDDVYLEDCVVWPGTRVCSGTHLRRAVMSRDFICEEVSIQPSCLSSDSSLVNKNGGS